jgi:hypothetical protein
MINIWAPFIELARMSGGVYTGRPFSFNIKCIVFTAFVAGGYWFLPPRRWWALAGLLWLPYVSMAWYDHLYSCSNAMDPTIVPFGRILFLPFKPESYQRKYTHMAQAQLDQMAKLDHVAAWTIVLVAGTLIARAGLKLK